MEVVSASNLVSPENEKRNNRLYFQTIAMNSFVKPHDLMRGQMGTYTYMQISSYS